MFRTWFDQCPLCANSGHLAMAAPATTKPADTATQTVKAERVALIKHHKIKLVHKVRMERRPTAKTVTTKS